MKKQIDPITRELEMNKELQQQQLDGRTAEAAPYILGEKQITSAALLEQLDPERVVEAIELTLKGEMRDPVTNEIKKKGEALMNELGISNIMSTVRSIVNANTTISALDEGMINKIVCNLSDEIGNDLELNWRIYEITNKANLDRVDGICKRMTYLALRRCLQGGERRFLGSTTVETISTAQRPMPQKKGNFLSRFKL